MKALLVTRCGCSRVIETAQGLEIIRVPVAPSTFYANDLAFADTEHRVFRYERRGRIGDETITLYRECASRQARSLGHECSTPAEAICDGCGKRDPMVVSGAGQWYKPEGWYQRTNKDGTQLCCSRECVDTVAERTGKTHCVLPV